MRELLNADTQDIDTMRTTLREIREERERDSNSVTTSWVSH